MLCQLGFSPSGARRNGAGGWFEQRRTEHNPRLPGDSAGGHSDSARQHRYATGRHRDSANRARANTWLNFTRLNFTQWNSEHRRPRVDLAKHYYARKHDAALHGQSQHAEHSGHFAQRFALWNFARHSERNVGFHPEYVQPQSADSRKSGQHQPVAGDDPVAGHALPASG